jgi:lambda family phage portal protein
MKREERSVAVLGPDGNPIKRKRGVAQMLAGGDDRFGGPPYDAADLYGQHMAAWTPMLWSPDAELNMYRDRIVSRVRDMVRNDGWAAGAVTRMLDNCVGANLRPIAKPDYRFLADFSGSDAFDHQWAKEFARWHDSHWRTWAHAMGCYCDASRNLTFGQMMSLGFRHKLVDGDALAVMHWLPDRVDKGRARYATAVMMVDPDRLSNPQLRFDQHTMRGGVKVDKLGAAVAYFIRKAHAGDWFNAVESLTWEEVPREDRYGRPIVVHDFDSNRAGQHRGGAGVFTPILTRLKMLIKWDTTEMDAAIINSIFSAYIESPFDHEMTAEALNDSENPQLGLYQQTRGEFHKGKSLMLGNSRIPMLFPGEQIKPVSKNSPGSNFEAFENAVLRNVASGLGLSAQQVSNNWSDVNYSSARGALLEAWKTLDRRRDDFAFKFAGPIRGAWLEEAMTVDEPPLPAGAPDYIQCRDAYTRARWQGPGRGWVDPVAEKQGAVIGMDAALSTLEEECAAQGLDFEEVLEQRRYELELFDEYNIPRPQWAGQMIQLGAGGDDAPPPGAPGSKSKKATPVPPQAE